MDFGASSCPSCGLPLEGQVAARLFTTLAEADELLAELRAATSVATQVTASAATPVGAGGATVPGTAVAAGPVPPPAAARPVEGVAPARGLSAASVPKILLGLGALCLLVAALVFLVVTWSVMGVAERTATLVGFTTIAGGLTWWVARRALRAAAESLALVTLGLLTFDVLGARSSGWLGDISGSGFLVVLGVVATAAGAAATLAVRRTPARDLVGTQIVAGLGIAAALAGVATLESFALSAGLVLGTVLAAAATYLVHLLRLPVTTALGLATTSAGWIALTLTSLERALTHPTLGDLWLDLEGWPLLVAAALAGSVTLVRPLPLTARLSALGAGEVVLGLAALAPATDETPTVVALSFLTALAVACVPVRLVPSPWHRGLVAGVAAAGLWPLTVTFELATTAVSRAVEAGSALWSGAAGDRLPPLDASLALPAPWVLPLAVVVLGGAVLTLARRLPAVDRMVGPMAVLPLGVAVLVASLVAATLLTGTPVWLVVALALFAGLAFTAWWRAQESPSSLGAAVAFLAGGTVVSLHDEWATLAATSAVLLASVVVHLRASARWVRVLAGVTLSAATAGTAWTACATADVDQPVGALVSLLVLVALVLTAPAVDRSWRVDPVDGAARLGAELAALGAAGAVCAAGVSGSTYALAPTWAAVYLTVAGAGVTAMALLRPDRREAGWLGGLLLVLASWVRLADVGVHTPEAYTLPAAVALGVVGVLQLRRSPEMSTMTALAPALALGLVPSLLWVLADPVALRSVLLGAACLVLLVAGVRIGWTAPVVFAATVGCLLVLRLVTPMTGAVPRWALIGAAGTLLVLMGITWERRLHEARTVMAYLRALR